MRLLEPHRIQCQPPGPNANSKNATATSHLLRPSAIRAHSQILSRHFKMRTWRCALATTTITRDEWYGLQGNLGGTMTLNESFCDFWSFRALLAYSACKSTVTLVTPMFHFLASTVRIIIIIMGLLLWW